jgi:hypothetical protein
MTTPAALERWNLCFAITRAAAQRDDSVFARQLYFGDLATDGVDGDDHPHRRRAPLSKGRGQLISGGSGQR